MHKMAESSTACNMEWDNQRKVELGYGLDRIKQYASCISTTLLAEPECRTWSSCMHMTGHQNVTEQGATSDHRLCIRTHVCIIQEL